MTSCVLAWAVILIAFPLILIFWLTESRAQRIQRMRRYGYTWHKIAAHYSVSPSTVRRWSQS